MQTRYAQVAVTRCEGCGLDMLGTQVSAHLTHGQIHESEQECTGSRPTVQLHFEWDTPRVEQLTFGF